MGRFQLAICSRKASEAWSFVTRGGERITGWIAMKLGRKLTWNPEIESFSGDETANSMRSRPQRAPYGISNMKRG